MLDKFYKICKFIVCLCGTVIVVIMTLSMIAVLLKQRGGEMTVGTAFVLGYFVGAICFFVSWCIAKKVIKKSEVEK